MAPEFCHKPARCRARRAHPRDAALPRAVFDRVGLFDETYLKSADDVDWISRAQHAGEEIGMLPEVMLLKGVHGNNVTYSRPAYRATCCGRCTVACAERRGSERAGDQRDHPGIQCGALPRRSAGEHPRADAPAAGNHRRGQCLDGRHGGNRTPMGRALANTNRGAAAPMPATAARLWRAGSSLQCWMQMTCARRKDFEWQMEALLADPRLEAVFGLMEQFRSPDLAPEEAAAIHCPGGAQSARMPIS